MKALAGYGILAVLLLAIFGAYVAAYGLAAASFAWAVALGIFGLVVVAAYLIASED